MTQVLSCRLLLVNHTLKIGGEIMADAPTNLMAKYYVQESSGDYSQSVGQSVYL